LGKIKVYGALELEGCSLPSLALAGGTSFVLSLALPFVFHVMVPAIGFYWNFLPIFQSSLTLIMD
jgi:hypothetical protein